MKYFLFKTLNLMQGKILFGLIIPILILSSCNGNKENSPNNQSDTMLPTSNGGETEIIVVVENMQERNFIKNAVDSIFVFPVPGLPQFESAFELRYIQIADFKNLYQKHLNILFVYDKEKDQRIIEYLNKNITSFDIENEFFKSKSDKWSSPQQLVFVSGQGHESIIQTIYQYANDMVEMFDKNSKKRLHGIIYQRGDLTKLTQRMYKNHQYRYDVPKNYQIIIEAYQGHNDSILNSTLTQGLIWLRGETKKSNVNILSYSTELDEMLFENIQGLFDVKNRVGRLVESEKEGAYMSIDTINMPYELKRISIDGKEAIEIRGLWQMENDWMGGPFIFYVIKDKKNNRMVFFDAFIYAPESKKKVFVKRLEVTLETIRL